MNIHDLVGRPAIRYLGQFKPTSPCRLSTSLILLPAGAGRFPYGPGASLIRLNESYLISTDEIDHKTFEGVFRDWLIFDAFILHDHFPIWYFEEMLIGSVMPAPAVPPVDPGQPEYKQFDYANIGHIVLETGSDQADGPMLTYTDLFARYRALSRENRELLEWFVSTPRRACSRLESFFNTTYTELLRITTLLERVVGLPPYCLERAPRCGICGNTSLPHYSMSRREWLRHFLQRITDPDTADAYARLITQGIAVRNKVAHGPLFDRSSLPVLEFGETATYDAQRAIEEYLDDSIAMSAFLISLRRVCRYLLLDTIFGTAYFGKLSPLHAMRVGMASSLA